MDDRTPRYAEVRERALRRRAAALGALTLVPSMALAACSNGDAALEAVQPGGTTATTTTVVTATTSTTVATTTSAVDTTTSVASGSAISAGSELTVAFTYDAASAGGRVNNPYIAVWIEDADGELVQTLSVWYLSGKGTKWLPELRRWVTVDGSSETLNTVSGATRTPGDYALAWDGTDLDGNLVEEGTYYVVVEAAREHGPYSLVREAVELGTTGFTASLTSDGELSGVEVTFDVA